MNSSLGALIAEAKKKKASDGVRKYMRNVLNFWYYGYLDAFHTHPVSIDDMFMGLRYLILKREVQDAQQPAR